MERLTIVLMVDRQARQ